jgi:hypothetical protein
MPTDLDPLALCQARIDSDLKLPLVHRRIGDRTPGLKPGEADVMTYNGIGCEWNVVPAPGFAVGVERFGRSNPLSNNYSFLSATGTMR